MFPVLHHRSARPRGRPARSGPHRTAALVAVAGIAVDQATKAITASSRCGRFLCPQRNHALMLGVPAGSAVSVVAASVLGLAAFAGWVRFVRRWVTLPAWVLGLVVAGIVSNLVDRLVSGSVRDFLAGPGGSLLNIADLLLGLGVLWALALVAVHRRPTRPRRSIERPDTSGGR